MLTHSPRYNRTNPQARCEQKRNASIDSNREKDGSYMTTIDNSTAIVRPANRVPGPKQGHWTYNDYAALPNDRQRYEVMNGVLIMAPAPTPEHQSISAPLTYYFLQAVEFAELGKVLPAPLDVELTLERVVQPDLTVLLSAHLQKVTKGRVVGAPDLVVEIASPSTALYDRLSKY